MQKLGKYEIVRELGRGAMGIVYEAKDPLIGRRVALKTITTGLSENPDLLERFKREAMAAGNLAHPNIVTIFELGEDRGTFFIAMEYLEGESLEQIIARKAQMSLLSKVNYFVQVCRGLGYAHERGVVHRDMKPANIMVMKDDTIKVVDFGIARLTAASSTKTGMMIGTVAYMSPEQVQGQHVDQRSDIWSVGVTFYELFCGQRPYSADNIAAVMFNIVTQDPKPLRDYLPDFPDDLEQLMGRIFQKKITERYQGFDDVLLDIEPIYKRLQQAGVSEMVEQARRMMTSGELDKSNEILRQVIQIEPGNREARTLRDQVRQEIAKRAQAPQAQENVNLAYSLLTTGRLTEAKSKVLDALRLVSHFGPAEELLRKIEDAQLLEQARQLKNEGRHTEADATVTQILARDPTNAEAQQLRAQIAAERMDRERRRQLDEKKQRARALWTQQNFDECLALLEQLVRENPGESEVLSLLETVKADKSEQERQAAIREVRRLLGEHKFGEAIEICEQRLKMDARDTVVQRLLEQVHLERKDHARRVRQQQEGQQLKKLVADGRYEDAIPRADAHLAEFPDDFEVRQLLEFARAQKAEEQRRALRAQKLKSVQSLIDRGDFEAAVNEAEQALAAIGPDDEFQQLLKVSQTKAKEKKEREAREFIQKQLAAMQSAIEREDFSNAIDVGRKTMLAAGQNKEITNLLATAEAKREQRDKKREEERAKEQMHTVVRQFRAGEEAEAAKALEDLSKTMVFDSKFQDLFQAVKEKKEPLGTMVGRMEDFLELPKDAHPEAATMIPAATPAESATVVPSTPPAPPAEAKTTVASKAEMDELLRTGPPVAERDFGKKKKKKKDKGGWRRDEDFEATSKWTEPPESSAGRFEETTKWEEPAAPAASAAPPAPAAPAANFGATTIGKIEDVVAPKPPAPKAPAADFGATTIGKVEDFKAPPPKKPATPAPPASFTATTVASPDKVTAPPPGRPPLLDDSATRIGSVDEVARVRSAAPPVDFTSTTIGKIDAPVAPPPPRREKKAERRAAEAPAIAVPPQEFAEPKKSSMGLIIGGVAAVAVIGAVLYFTVLKKPDAGTQTGGGTSIEGPSTAGGAGAGTTPGSGGTPPTTTTPPPIVAPPVDPWKTPDGQKVQRLLDEARRLSTRRDFATAKRKIQEAQKLAPDGVMAAAIQKELSLITQAEAEGAAFQAKMDKDNELWSQIVSLRQNETEENLQRALTLANSGIAANGPRVEDFTRAKPEIEARITFVRGEGTRRAMLSEGQQLLRQERFGEARAKARELAGAGGDASGLSNSIQTAEQNKKNQLDAMFDRLKSQNNDRALEQLVAEYRKMIYDGGPLAGDAREMAENRIPAEISRIRTPAKVEPPTKTTTPAPVTCAASFRSFAPPPEKYTGPLGAGRLISDSYVDGGVKLTSNPVPTEILQQNCGKSVRIRFDVNEAGKVTAGTVITGDVALGKLLIDVAQKSWQFNPPKVSNTPVKTNTTFQITIQQ